MSLRIRASALFEGDDLRRVDPKFQPPRFGQYLAAAARLDELAQRRFGKRVIHLAVRWMLDRGITMAQWGARHPGQLPASYARRLRTASAQNSWRRPHDLVEIQSPSYGIVALCGSCLQGSAPTITDTLIFGEYKADQARANWE
jgi:hypothetical protein